MRRKATNEVLLQRCRGVICGQSFRVAALITVFALLAALHGRSAAKAEQIVSSPPSLASAMFPQPLNWPLIAGAAKSQERLGPGITYERWKLETASGPLSLSIARIDLRNPYVSLTVASHHDVVVDKGERLSEMADRAYAELGINADYFDINESGSPLNVLALDGKVLHEPDRAAAFLLDHNGTVTMKALTWHAHITAPSGFDQDIALMNELPPTGGLALVTNQLGAASTAPDATEVVFTPISQPNMYVVNRESSNLSGLYGLQPLEIGLVARGSQYQNLLQQLPVGQMVSITNVGQPAIESLRLAIGGGPLLLSAGNTVDDPDAPAPDETNVRNPVTAAGTSSDGNTLIFVVVDGRSPHDSIGLTRPMLASLMSALGCANAMAFDSGGSSEMVIRHLGDLSVAVANIPSDGRERSIADALLVQNSAPIGPAQTLMLAPEDDVVLAGSHVRLRVTATDANMQPVPIEPNSVDYSVSPTSLAVIGPSTVLNALVPGTVSMVATLGNIASAPTQLKIVPALNSLSITGYSGGVRAASTSNLGVDARDASGQEVAVDRAAVRWRSQGTGGHVSADGLFHASAHPGVTQVFAYAGGREAAVDILVGDHPLVLEEIPQAGSAANQWRALAQPSQLHAVVDNVAAPDGSAALHLNYDLASDAIARAAYAASELRLCGTPRAISLDVFGDNNGEWLRGGYRNADGNNESLTLARHVDWQGWKTIRVPIPPQAAWPIVWTRLYVVERLREAQEHGDLWFKNITAIYPGPTGYDPPDCRHEARAAGRS